MLITTCGCAEQTRRWYAQWFWIEAMFSDQKSRALNLESSRMTDSNRLQRLLVAVCLAYLWMMELGRLWSGTGICIWLTVVAQSARSASGWLVSRGFIG